MSAYVIITYDEDYPEPPTLNVFPTTEAAERFYVEDAADEWRHACADEDDPLMPEPTDVASAEAAYEYVGGSRKVYLLAEGHASVYEHDDERCTSCGRDELSCSTNPCDAVLEDRGETRCDECGVAVPAAGSTVSAAHEYACSLYPDND